MALTRNIEFMDRVVAMMAFVTNTVLNEPGSTAYHQLRASYAQRVVNMPQQTAQTAAPQVVMGVNVVATTVYDETTKTSTCSIADLDLQSQIVTLWNSLAGIDSPS